MGHTVAATVLGDSLAAGLAFGIHGAVALAALDQTCAPPRIAYDAGSRTMPKGTTWYRRLADIPGIGYAGDDALRARLPDRDAKPRVERFEFDGERTTTLSWRTSAGEGSTSPVQSLAHATRQNELSDEARARVLTALELPGEPGDYHFAIQGVADLLWDRRREEPQHLPFVEWLSWLDVRLVEAHPEAVRASPDKDEYFRITALHRLVDLYEREGFLREALAAAERFARFRPRVDISELRVRVARLNAEHG